MVNSSASKIITGFVLIQWQHTYYSCWAYLENKTSKWYFCCCCTWRIVYDSEKEGYLCILNGWISPTARRADSFLLIQEVDSNLVPYGDYWYVFKFSVAQPNISILYQKNERAPQIYHWWLLINHSSLSFSFRSGRRWVAMMKTSTPSGPTRCVMSSSPVKTTGSSPPSLIAVEHSASMWRFDSLCATAAPSPTSLAHARRRLISTTMKLMLSLPQKAPPSGWRPLTSRWTPLLQMKASHRWTSADAWWRSTQKCGASAHCLKMASTWPFRTMAPACLCCQSGSFIRSAQVWSRTLQSFQRPWQGLKAPPWLLPEESAFPTQRKSMSL